MEVQTGNTIKMYDFRNAYLSIANWFNKHITVNKSSIRKHISDSIKLIQAVYYSDYKYVDDVIAIDVLLPEITYIYCEYVAIFNGDFKMFNRFYDESVWEYKTSHEIIRYVHISIDGESMKMLKWLFDTYYIKYSDVISAFKKFAKHGSTKILKVLVDYIMKEIIRKEEKSLIIWFNTDKILANLFDIVYSKRFIYGKTELLDYMINCKRCDIEMIICVSYHLHPTVNVGRKSKFVSYILMKSKFDSFILLDCFFLKYYTTIPLFVKQVVLEVYWETVGKYLYSTKMIPKDIKIHISQLCVSKLLRI